MSTLREMVLAAFGGHRAGRFQVPRGVELGLAGLSAGDFVDRLPSLLLAAASSTVSARLTRQAVGALLVPPHHSPLSATEYVRRIGSLTEPQRLVVQQFLRSHALAWAEAGLDELHYAAQADSLERFWDDPSDARLRAFEPTHTRGAVAARLEAEFPVGGAPKPEQARQSPLQRLEPDLCRALYGRTWTNLAQGWFETGERSALWQLAPRLVQLDAGALAYYLPAFMTVALETRLESDPTAAVAAHTFDLLADPSQALIARLTVDQRSAVREFCTHLLQQFGEPGGIYLRGDLEAAVELYWPEPEGGARPVQGTFSYEPAPRAAVDGGDD